MNLYTFFNRDVVAFIDYLQEYNFKNYTLLTSLVNKLNSVVPSKYEVLGGREFRKTKEYIPQLIRALNIPYNNTIHKLLRVVLTSIYDDSVLIKTEDDRFVLKHAITLARKFELTPDGGLTIDDVTCYSVSSILYRFIEENLDDSNYTVDFLGNGFYTYNMLEFAKKYYVPTRFNYNQETDTYSLVSCPYGSAINGNFKRFVQLMEYVCTFFLGADKVFTVRLTNNDDNPDAGIYTYTNKKKKAYKLTSKEAKVAIRLILVFSHIFKPNVRTFSYLKTTSALLVPALLAKYEKQFGNMETLLEAIKR